MIELKNIVKSYDENPLLDGVNLFVEKNTSMALMGSSASGKTVLLKIITGLINPDSGRVIIGGSEVIGAARRELDFIREKIGMIFQSSALFDSMTVRENIGFALKRIPGMTPDVIGKKVREAMDQVKLDDVEDLYPTQLSGGMKKRVGIARAVVARPEILLADEPAAGLDPSTSRTIVKLLARIVKDFKMTCVIVTTSLEIASIAADKVAFLHKGKIETVTTPEEMASSKNEIARRFAMLSNTQKE